MAIFERYNYEKPTYGKIDPSSFLQSSQFTHNGILIRSDKPEHLKFYDECMGLLRQKEQVMGGQPTCSSGRMSTTSEMRDVYDLSKPGCLGMTLLTYQVRDITTFRQRVIKGGAIEVTDIAYNEFNEQSISFKSPDGLIWNLVGTL